MTVGNFGKVAGLGKNATDIVAYRTCSKKSKRQDGCRFYFGTERLPAKDAS
jgi:hypothetical protein